MMGRQTDWEAAVRDASCEQAHPQENGLVPNRPGQRVHAPLCPPVGVRVEVRMAVRMSARMAEKEAAAALVAAEGVGDDPALPWAGQVPVPLR